MNRIFQSFKKRNSRFQIKFVSDKLNVDWNILLDALDKARVKESENEVKRLSYKRRKLHLDLHSEANNQVEQLIIVCYKFRTYTYKISFNALDRRGPP